MPIFSKKSIVIATAGLALVGGVSGEAEITRADTYYTPFLGGSRLCCSRSRNGPCYDSNAEATKDTSCYIQIASDEGEGYDSFRLAYDPVGAIVVGPDGFPTVLACMYSKASSIPNMPDAFKDLKLYWQVDPSGSVYARRADSCPTPSDPNNLEPGKYFYIPPGTLDEELYLKAYMGPNTFYNVQLGGRTQIKAAANLVENAFLLAAGSPLRQNVEYRFRYSHEGNRYTLRCKLMGDGCVVAGFSGEGFDLGKWSIVPRGGPSSYTDEIRKESNYCLFWNSSDGKWFQITKPDTSSGLIGTRVASNSCDDNMAFSIYPGSGPLAKREEVDVRFGPYGLKFYQSSVTLVHAADEIPDKIAAYHDDEYDASRSNENQETTSAGALIAGAAAGGAIVGAGLLAVATVLRNKRTGSISDDSETAITVGDLQGDNPAFKFGENEVAENLEEQL